MDEHIESIEAGYEYLLAYAAQGKDTDVSDAGGVSEVRATLDRMAQAAVGIVSLLESSDQAFDSVVVGDAKKAHAAISLVLGQKGISSEIVDNLNASIHLRALLTDLFLLSEVTR